MSMAQSVERPSLQARASFLRGELLLLPRPWLTIEQCHYVDHRLYVKGMICLDGRMVNLPYWHRISTIHRLRAVEG